MRGPDEFVDDAMLENLCPAALHMVRLGREAGDVLNCIEGHSSVAVGSFPVVSGHHLTKAEYETWRAEQP